MFKKYFFFSFLIIIFFAFPGNAKASYHDLEITTLTTSPSPPVFNSSVDIIITVSYEGDEELTDLTGIKEYDYNFENFTLSKVTLPTILDSSPLKNGTSFQVIFKGTFNEKGDATLSYDINSDKKLYEAAMSNNSIRVDVTVVPPNDLSVNSIILYPIAPTIDQEALIQIDISNQGVKDLVTNTGFHDFDFDFENFIEDSRTIPEISSSNRFTNGDVLTFIFEGKFASEGKKNLEFNINTDNRLDESSYSNNSASNIYTVGSLDSLDIEVESLTINKEAKELIVGDAITVTANIRNKSDFSISSDLGLLERDYRFISGGDYEFLFEHFEIETVSHSDYPSPEDTFDPEEIMSYIFTGKAKNTGSGVVSFKIDIRNKLEEKDETNNAYTIPYIVYNSQDEIDSFGVLENEVKFISTSSVKVVWTTDKITDGYIMIKNREITLFDRWLLASGLEEWPSSNETEEHEVRIDNLLLDEVYRYILVNDKNEIENKTDLKEFTMPQEGDFSILNIPSATPNDEEMSVQITWQSDWLTHSKVFYKLNTGGTYLESFSDLLTDSHDITLSSLDSGEYNYYVSSISEGGTEKSSDVQNFKIGTIEEIEDEIEENTEEEMEDESSTAEAMEGRNEEDNITEPEEETVTIKNQEMYNSLKGKIILKVESNGEAYYINPQKETIHYLGRPEDAFQVMREQGIGIKNNDLYKIPVGIGELSGDDSDNDGISDLMEDALGLNKDNSDSDGDTYSDKDELLSGFSPWTKDTKLNLDYDFSENQKGKIFLQVENNGEAWYVNPSDSKRYFLGRPADAFGIMRYLGLGISNDNFNNL